MAREAVPEVAPEKGNVDGDGVLLGRVRVKPAWTGLVEMPNCGARTPARDDAAVAMRVEIATAMMADNFMVNSYLFCSGF
jgi:hypothetical protein